MTTAKTIALSVLCAGFMIGVSPLAQAQCAGPNKFTCPNPNGQSWQIFELLPGFPFNPVEVGYVFFIKKVGNKFHWEPIGKMAIDWGIEESIEMENTTAQQDVQLCARFVLQNEDHNFWVRLDAGNDSILAAYVYPADSCEDSPPTPSGGGRAMN